tara:strand:- start:2071 stop:2196 length:126 start_codon:yes stop_codon:yes gene_type:complete
MQDEAKEEKGESEAKKGKKGEEDKGELQRKENRNTTYACQA